MFRFFSYIKRFAAFFKKGRPMTGSVFLKSLPEATPAAERSHLEKFYASMPLHLQDIVDRAAAITTASQDTVQKSIGLIDHTSLKDGPRPMEGGETPAEIEKLCRDAKQGVAAVCVYPNHIETALEALKGSSVRLAVVNNFPHGGQEADTAAASARDSIARGAQEIDTVIYYTALRLGYTDMAKDRLRAVAEACEEGGAALKTILKASVYETWGALRDATDIAIETRPATQKFFVKTCTGKNPVSGYGPGGADASNLLTIATVMQAVAESAAKGVGVKFSGGIKTPVDCERVRFIVSEIAGPGFFQPDLVRFGASSLLANLAPKTPGGTPSPAPAASY
jgi:deoxyribose-phosphate aldolase